MMKLMTAENGVQANNQIARLTQEGYSRENIYLFAHNEERKEHIASSLVVEEVGVTEKGLVNTMKNLVSKRGDELKTEFESIGLTFIEAEECTQMLNEGKLVIVAKQDV